MSCYFRQLNDIFEFAGIQVTPQNRKDIDRAIHELVEVEYKSCPKAWKALKAAIADQPDGRKAFSKRLKAKLGL